MRLRHSGFTYRAYEPFTKNKEIKDIFIKTNKIKRAFNIIWLLEILRIYFKKQRLIKYYAIKQLILLKIQNMMDFKEVLLRWFINFLIKSRLVVVSKMIVYQTKK